MKDKVFNEDAVRKLLHSLKLGKYETEVYLNLLKYGPQEYKRLTERSGVPLGKIYYTLNALGKKGWIKNLDQKPRIFFAVDPEEPLNEHLVRMKKQLLNMEEAFHRIIPQLQRLYKQSH